MANAWRRDDAQFVEQLPAWMQSCFPARSNARVTAFARPVAGWSNETVLVTLAWQEDGRERQQRMVVRLPTPVPTFPVYDLAAQARVLEVLAGAGIPVPALLAFEPDVAWLGAPFLVMAHVPGRAAGEAPGLDPWIVESSPALQARLQEEFLETLAAIHRVDWSMPRLGDVLRGATAALRDEVDWWIEYSHWAADRAPARGLVDALAWCRANVPPNEARSSLLWGDARLGNVMFDDDRRVTAVLDWELATIGPAEMDLAWYLALDELTTRFTRAPVAGFVERELAIAQYERGLGRRVVDLEWHEVFALARSIAINDRQARMATAAGVPYPGIVGDDNPVLAVLHRRIERY